MKNDWFLYGEWNDIPILALDTWNGQYNNLVLKSILGDYLRVLMFWKDNCREIMYVSKSSETKMMELAKKKFQEDPKFFHNIIDSYRSKRQAIMDRFDEINLMDLTELSNDQLIDIFMETRKLIGYCNAHDWFSFSFDKRILEVVGLNKYLKLHPGEREAILSLTIPDAILPTLAEEIEVLKIAKKAKGMNETEIKKRFEDELAALEKRFGWLPALIYYPLKTESDYLKHLIETLSKGDVEEELNMKLNFVKHNQQRLSDYIAKKDPPKEIIDAIIAVRKMSEIRAIGEMDGLYCFSRCRKLDKEIRKRLNLERDDYLNLYMREVVNLLKGDEKINKDDLEKRKKLECMYRDEKGEFQRHPEPEKIFNKLQAQKVNTTELRGMPAYPGIVTGKVRIIKSSQDLHSFKKGEILVAKATCVDYVVIMKKAGAIVTEFGGVTSHAAIVSHELRVPCIIGVSGVTQQLKDGDDVTVDAEKGVIAVKDRLLKT